MSPPTNSSGLLLALLGARHFGRTVDGIICANLATSEDRQHEAFDSLNKVKFDKRHVDPKHVKFEPNNSIMGQVPQTYVQNE